MLDLLKHLKDLKALLGAQYYGELKEVALAALAGDWKGVAGKMLDLAKAVVMDQLFPVPAVKAGVAEVDLDAAFSDLEDATLDVGAAAADPAAIDPNTIISLVLIVFELIKQFKKR